MELSNLRQLPGLAHRPNFPCDLHVLLLDTDFKARQEAESQLRENQYSVTPCSCAVEAAAFLANPDNCCDVLLADVRCLQQKSAENTAVIQAAKSIPLVLMSESGTPNEVMLGIKLGAVDFLEKPLSPLKLKNIWQHLVRRLLTMSTALQPKKAPAASGTASPEDSGCHGGGSGTHSHGSGGESGSNASTSDQAAVKVEYDLDMETSSFQDTMGCMAALTANVALLNARVGDGATTRATDGCPCATASGAPLSLEAMQLSGSLTGTGPGANGCSKPRPQPHKYKAHREPAPGAGVGGSSCGPKPVIGYPAGQMPPLPEGIPGIEWGLPTNPLQISPKAPAVGGFLGPMGWPVTSLMPPPLFPMMLPTPSPSISSGCCTLPLSSSCLTLSSASNLAPVSLSMKRSDSAPLPALSNISTSSAATTATAGMDGFLQPPGSRVLGVFGGSLPCSATGMGPGKAAADLLIGMGMDTDKGMLPPPIGLRLKKSPSLADFISQSLDEGTAAAVVF